MSTRGLRCGCSWLRPPGERIAPQPLIFGPHRGGAIEALQAPHGKVTLCDLLEMLEEGQIDRRPAHRAGPQAPCPQACAKR